VKIKLKVRKKTSHSKDEPVEQKKEGNVEEKVEQVVGRSAEKQKPLEQKEEIAEKTEKQPKTEKIVEVKEKGKDKTKKQTKKKKKTGKKKTVKTEEKKLKKEKAEEPKQKKVKEEVKAAEEEKSIPKPEIIEEKVKIEEPGTQIKEEEPLLKPEEIAEIIKLDTVVDDVKPGETKEKGKPKIMVVDDEHDILFSVEQVLKTSEYDVIAVDSGEKCFDHLKRGELPDLIVLDIMMPVLSGWEVQRRLERNIDWKDIPIIFLTARTTEAAKEMCKRLGADYISKPFDIDDLKQRIENILKGKPNQ